MTASPIAVEGPRWQEVFRGRRVFMTGHTGFKGGWLTLWLSRLGARVTGYALAPGTQPSLFEALDLGALCERHQVADIRDRSALRQALRDAAPEIVFHLAAQPLALASYLEPHQTFETNVMGTANVLEALRAERLPAAVVVVTSDKCYENREWHHAYREDDPLGGHDPYSASKAAAEVVVASYRRSFFPPDKLAEHGVALASVRSGNVIGGGDWAKDRIVPDAVAALVAGRPIAVRNPRAIRPWQHVLEPLSGYLRLAARLAVGSPADRERHCQAWNFGPGHGSARPVRDLVEGLIAAWGSGTWEERSSPDAPHEGSVLRLAIEKAVALLGWQPRWTFGEMLQKTSDWYQAFHRRPPGSELREFTVRQIESYLETSESGGRR